MRKIRFTRVRKFRKKYRTLILGIEVLMIWYFIVFSGVELNSYTNAAFNDIEVVNSSLNTKWDTDIDEWDKSSLNFDGAIVSGTCGRISTTINTNENPIIFSTWRYYVYKVPDTGQKTPIGDPIDTGVVPFMAGNSSATLVSTKVVENGTYRFRVRRPLGHPGQSELDSDGYSYFWSDPIVVTNCSK